MGYISRGDNFVAYYGVPSGTPSGLLNGIHWEHSVDCGTYVIDNETFILRCIHFFKDLGETFGDPVGVHAEAFDYSLPFVEDLAESSAVVQVLIGDAPEGFIRSVVEAAEGLHPLSKALILRDLDEGLSGPQIAENRAALLDPKFLGFTFGDVLGFLPEGSCRYDTGAIMILEDGTEEPVIGLTIYPCSMETW